MSLDVDATWANAPTATDAPVYDAADLRRADAALFAGTNGGLGARGGIVRHGDTSLTVAVDGADVLTVQPGAVVIPGDAVAGTGVYRSALPTAYSEALTARNATNPRIDLVVFRMLDTDVVGTHTARTGRVEIIPGTPASAPGVPVKPSMAVELSRVTVPASGGGAATVDSSYRSYATGPGGEIVAESFGRLPAVAAVGQRSWVIDTGREYRWDGTQWALQGASGSRVFTFSAEASKTAVITLPAGFAATPKIFLSVDHSFASAQFVANSTGVSPTGFTIRVADSALANRSGGVTVNWRAVP